MDVTPPTIRGWKCGVPCRCRFNLYVVIPHLILSQLFARNVIADICLPLFEDRKATERKVIVFNFWCYFYRLMNDNVYRKDDNVRLAASILNGGNTNGKQTSVDRRYVANNEQHPKLWYHGNITREHTEKILSGQADGTFLVRDSTNFPGDYTLCMAFNGKVEHY
ncbi:unnamed protein product, partial [Brugia timori]|uniref:SH2 domain-containing protein n=1 Tax=Brugia timori TaxID=42155 RepID=A0A0R3Q7N6_9BILA